MSNDTNNNFVGLSQSYIEHLTQELETAENCYKEFQNVANKAKDEYDLAQEWESCVLDYYSKLNITYKMVIDLDSYVVSFEKHAQNMCTVVDHAKGATNILMICVRCLSKQNEELKELIKNLLEIIDCLNNPVLDSNVSIMKCLKDLETKVNDGITANLVAIKKMLHLMRCMFDLLLQICSKKLTPEQKKLIGKEMAVKEQGLLYDLCRLQRILDCTYPYGAASSDTGCGKPDAAYATPSLQVLTETFTSGEDGAVLACKNDCGPDIQILDVPASINCREERLRPQLCTKCGDGYLKKLKAKLDHAKELVCYLKYVWRYFYDLEQKAKSNRDATQNALTAAQKAKDKCK